MARGLSCRAAGAGPTDGHHPAASHPHTGLAAGSARRCPPGQQAHTSQWSYMAPRVCDASPRSRIRHAHSARTSRAQGRQDDDEVDARAQSGWSGGQEPSRPPVGGTLTGTCRVWPVECMMHANGYGLRSHERIWAEVSRWRERIRYHIVRRLARVLSVGKSHKLLSCSCL
jgi:hypothetical protein